MAAGALVPHKLPNGQTIMVPDYLAPKGALAMPDVTPPPAGPDLRVAGVGMGAGPADWGNDIPALPSLTPEEMRAQLAPAPKLAPSTKEHARPPTREQQLASLGSKPQKAPSGVDPSTLARPQQASGAQAPSGEGGDMDPLVRQVFNESLRRGGGGGPRRPGGMVQDTVKVEREGGKELLPELRRRMGLDAYEYEVDPFAEQPTIGTEDPIMRKKLSPLERAASGAADGAARREQAQIDAERQLGIQRSALLAQQSEEMDAYLATIAERRNRIASMQEAADKRIREAESFEPRTKAQVWENKGGLAQVMGILSMAIGGYTQGLGRSGGRNPGWDLVNKVLDDEVAGDVERFERRRKIGMDAKNDVERAMAQYGDLEMAKLEARNRKLASVMAMTQQQMANKALDATALDRVAQIRAAAEQALLEGAQQQFDLINGKVIKEESIYKQAPMTGGGGGNTTLKAIEDAARAKKGLNTIMGVDGKPAFAREVQNEKVEGITGALEAIEASKEVTSLLDQLGADSDFDDPTTGPYDSTIGNLPGTERRRLKQRLEQQKDLLARGIQQSLGKSDNDARLADEMAAGGGSGLGRREAAKTAGQRAVGRLQTIVSSLTPDQQQALLESLEANSPERAKQVRAAISAVASTPRAASEEAVR